MFFHKCSSCKKKIKKAIFVRTQNNHYCSYCFVRFIERKFKANLSKNNLIDEGDVIKLSKSRKPNVLAVNHIFHKIFDDNPSINLSYKRGNKRVNYLVAEELLFDFLNKIGDNESFFFSVKKVNQIFPCYNFMLEDFENYCKAKKIEFIKKGFARKQEILLKNFLDSIIKIRPGAVYSAIRTLEELDLVK